jgi:hypothetical protein
MVGCDAFFHESDCELRITFMSFLLFFFFFCVHCHFSGNNEGLVYVYTLSAPNSSTWELQATLSPKSVGGTDSHFGFSVDFESSTNTLVVGARGYQPKVFDPSEDGEEYQRPGLNLTEWRLNYGVTSFPRSNNGSVHVFELDATTGVWKNVSVIQSPVGVNSYFGCSVAINGGRLVVGADGFRK